MCSFKGAGLKIFVVAGGTGGHLFPAIRLTEELCQRHIAEVIFVTSSRKQDIANLQDKGILFFTLPIVGFQIRGFWYVSSFIVRLIFGTMKSLFLLLRCRPSVVIGFGGYVTGPIVLLAAMLNIKTIIHEQNVYPGRANKILSRFVDKIAINFPETKKYLKGMAHKVIVSGNPLRKSLKRGKKTNTGFTILTMGGSQGSHALNRLVPEALGLISGDKKKVIDVIHIAGNKEKDDVTKAYHDRKVRNRVFSFTDEIGRLYNESDFVIARAGATTVSELLYLGKPSILIPYPHAGAHQRLNAKILSDAGIAVLLEEKQLTVQLLSENITKFMDKGVLADMAGKVTDRNNDACEILIKECIEDSELNRFEVKPRFEV